MGRKRKKDAEVELIKSLLSVVASGQTAMAALPHFASHYCSLIYRSWRSGSNEYDLLTEVRLVFRLFSSPQTVEGITGYILVERGPRRRSAIIRCKSRGKGSF